MNVTEERLTLWAKPLSETEDAKCVNAQKQLTDAMRTKFGSDVRVLLQGSYANDTNVRQDSDIDMVVIRNGHYFPDVSSLQPHEQQVYWQSTFQPATYTFDRFKADVHAALIEAFPGAVEHGEKCFKIKANTTRMNADVVASFEHHRHSSPTVIQYKGVSFLTKSNVRVDSFPEQHQSNGAAKNDVTGRAYKQMVRILKNVRTELLESGAPEAEPMKSFFIECLVWNVPDTHFNGTTYRDVAREVVAKIWNDMRNPAVSTNYLEVSQLFWLFRGQSRTPAEAEAFMLKVWNYLTP